MRGRWNGRAVYAKKFTGSRAKKHFERDLFGVSTLSCAHIATPELLYKGEVESGFVAVFAMIDNALNAETGYVEFNDRDRLALMNRLVETVAKHHQAGLVQTDLYFKNFLIDVNSQTVYTLDGDGIRKFETLSQQQALENFAVLLSKMDALEVEAWGKMLLASYHATHQKFSFSLETLKKLSAKFRTQAAAKYAKKVLRTCTDVEVKKTDGNFVAIARQDEEALPNLAVVHLDDAIKTAKILKNGRTCTVALVDFSGKKYVVKRYNIKHIGHFFWRMLRKTRAENSWVNAHRLTLLGISTAKPVALVEQRFGGLKGKAYFLTEFLDAPDIQQFFKTSSDKVARAEVLKNTVQLFYRLFLLKISHGDFKATNIKIAKLTPVLIDLDSMRQHHCDFFAERAHVRDLKRFMQNWKDDTSLYNALLKTFKVVYEDHAVLRKARLFIED